MRFNTENAQVSIYCRETGDSTDENDRLQKISHQLDVNGYDLFIDCISYK